MAAGDIIFEDGTIITPADLDKLIPLITNALGSTAKDPSEYPILERLDDLTSLPVFDAAYNLGRVSILRLKGVNGKNAILRVQGDMLQWSLEGTDIWNDLYSKSELKGDPGAAANMEIGEVTSGDTPAATITGEAPNYKLNLVLVPGGKGDAGDNGKTPVLTSVSAQSGETASGSFTDDGVDESGNPKYILNLTLPKGQDGQPAVFQQGTTTTLNPSEEARVEVIENGLTPEGNPKYLLNFFIPRGQMGPAGTGSGNVSADGTGLVIGKKYLFVPNADGSTAGTFVEYTPPGNATADSSGLMSAAQFQKLEKLNPSSLSNDVTGKKVEYTDAGKLLFEDKETFAVDADNELTLAGKKLSELGSGGSAYLDLSPLLDAEGNPVTTVTDEFLAQIENAYNNHVVNGFIGEGNVPILLISESDAFRIRLDISGLIPPLNKGMNDLQLIRQEFEISKIDKSVKYGFIIGQIVVTGDGTKALMDDATYQEVVKEAPENGKTYGRKNKDWVEVGGDYQLPSATDSVLGGIKIGYVASEKNYPVQLDGSNKAYVNVPWTDTNTTYDLATTSTNGLMSSTDKTKLDKVDSYVTASSISNLDVTKKVIYVALTANGSLSANNAGAAYNGQSFSVKIYCSSARTITIPTSGNYVSMCGSSYTCPAGKRVEFHFEGINGQWWIAKLEQE